MDDVPFSPQHIRGYVILRHLPSGINLDHLLGSGGVCQSPPLERYYIPFSYSVGSESLSLAHGQGEGNEAPPPAPQGLFEPLPIAYLWFLSLTVRNLALIIYSVFTYLFTFRIYVKWPQCC